MLAKFSGSLGIWKLCVRDESCSQNAGYPAFRNEGKMMAPCQSMIPMILVVPGASKMLSKVKSGCLKTGALKLESLGTKNGASYRNLSRSDICSSGLILCSVGRRKVCRDWGFAWRKQVISRRAADVRQSSDENPEDNTA